MPQSNVAETTLDLCHLMRDLWKSLHVSFSLLKKLKGSPLKGGPLERLKLLFETALFVAA